MNSESDNILLAGFMASDMTRKLMVIPAAGQAMYARFYLAALRPEVARIMIEEGSKSGLPLVVKEQWELLQGEAMIS
jgi:hypothetical protein